MLRLDEPRLNQAQVQAGAGRHQRYLCVQVRGLAGRGPLPINLALVLDRSGSMHGQPIRALRESAEAILQGLQESGHDFRLSVVAYDHQAAVLVGSTGPEGVEAARRAIRELDSSGGGTCIEAGMERALEELEKVELGRYVNHVYLLTDGHNEHGEDAACRRLAEEGAAAGVRFFTFGLGTHWNPDLLEAISDRGGGSMHHVERPREMAERFREELRRTVTSAAKGVSLVLSARDDLLRLAEKNPAFQVAPDVVRLNPEPLGRGWKFPLGDLSSDGVRRVIFQVYLTAPGTGTQEVGEVRACHRDLGAAGREVEAGRHPVRVLGVGQVRPGEADAEVEREVNRMKTYMQEDLATRLLDQGETRRAVTLLRKACETALQAGDQGTATVLQQSITRIQREGRDTDEGRIRRRSATKLGRRPEP